MKLSSQKGFSVIEVILAAALFVIITSGIVGLTLQGIGVNRLSAEQAVATQYAVEGLEAARSIKNQAFSSLANTTGTGIVKSGSVWQFSGTNNTFDNNRYTRVIKVESVNRDAVPPLGNITASGTNDPDTKKITSTVTWNFTNVRPQSVDLVTYLTDWEDPIPADALLVYDDATTTPKYRSYYNSGGFTSAASTIVGSSGRYFSVKTSPTKREAVAGYINATGTLQIMCFNGTTWTNDWSIAVGGTGTTRRFAIAYERNSGDVMVVYSRNTAAANALAYRTKLGSTACGSANWTAATNFATTPSATTGTVQWVKAAYDPRSTSNNLTFIWADSNSDLGVNNWSGTAWATNAVTFKALETSLDFVSAAQDSDNFDLTYESTSGEPMVVWGNFNGGDGTNGARYSTCTGGVYTCTWTAAAAVPTVSDDVHNIDISANPNTDQLAYAALGDAGDDLTAAYWTGSAWTGYANLDTTAETPLVGSKLVSTVWLINGSTTRWIIVYDDATGTGIEWYLATPGSTPVQQTEFAASPAINDIRERYEAESNPLSKEQALVALSDSTRSIFIKSASMNSSGTVTWANADGASLGITSAIPQQGFSFGYWRTLQ